MIDVNPVDVAVEMIRAALPGFESRVDPAIDAVVIHGALPITSQVSAQAIFYPLMRPAYIDPAMRSAIALHATEAELEIMRAQQRDALRLELAPIVERIVDTVRGYGIEALGLKGVIEDRERRARIDGRRLGFVEGKGEGRREGMAARIRLFSDEELREELRDRELAAMEADNDR